MAKFSYVVDVAIYGDNAELLNFAFFPNKTKMVNGRRKHTRAGKSIVINANTVGRTKLASTDESVEIPAVSTQIFSEKASLALKIGFAILAMKNHCEDTGEAGPGVAGAPVPA